MFKSISNIYNNTRTGIRLFNLVADIRELDPKVKEAQVIMDAAVAYQDSLGPMPRNKRAAVRYCDVHDDVYEKCRAWRKVNRKQRKLIIALNKELAALRS